MKKLFFYTFILIFISTFSDAQPWMSQVNSENPSFYEIRDAFYAYWKNKPYEKGKGYKQFKRWEYYWETRLLPNGDFPKSSVTVEEWLNYKNSHTNEDRSSVAANWTFKGPSSSASGYSGIGRINCIAFHPSNANTFWVGTPAGGLWKTTNGGLNWTTNSDNFPVLGVSDIAIDPTNANIMYLATGDGDMGSLSALIGGANGDTKSIGVLKSTDGGNTWTNTGLNWTVQSTKLIRRLIINPNNPQILMAAASDGIWRTSNGGTTWSNVQTGYFMDMELKPGDPNYVYASTFDYAGNASIYRSTNAGISFNFIGSVTDGIRINLEVTPNNPSLVDMVVVNNQSGLQGLWYSNDSGFSFNEYFSGNCNNNLLNNSYDASGCGGQGIYDLAYCINPNNYNEIWVGGVNTWATDDGGLNFYPMTMWNDDPTSNPNGTPVVHADKHDLKFHPLQNNTLYECNDGGLYRTSNSGASWTDLSNGLGISQLYRIGVSQTNNDRVISGLQDNGSKELKNGNWSDVTGGDGMECIIDYTNPNTQYASYHSGELYRTTDGWNNQTTISDNIPGQPTGAWVTPYIMHPTNPQILFAGYNKVFKTTNQGNTWTAISPALSDALRSIVVAPSNPNVIYAASFDTIYVTTDGGNNWNYIPLNITGAKISYLAVHPTNPQKVFVTLSGYSSGNKIYYSNDGGANWINYSGTLPNLPVNCVVYQNGSNDALYIGTDVGVFYREANANDWTPYQTGLPNVVVTELEISYNNNKLWAATFGRGLWNSDLNPTTVGTNNIINKNDFLNIYPNPNQGIFNIETNIDKYEVNIYNMLGELVYVESNINSTKKIFDLSALNNGVYFIKLVSENKSVIQKFAISAH
jgi:photosystem II stability/assembly factor-like uncharacterized protein